MKLFKKIACLLLLVGVAFSLVACNISVDEEIQDIVLKDEFSSWELKVGDKFDPFNGLVATDEKGENAFGLVQVSHLIPLDEAGCVTTSGTYQVKYLLEIGEQKLNLYRTVTVIFEIPETDKLIVNGDFELGTFDPFTKSEFDNGGCTLSAVKNGENNELCIDITGVSWQVVSPRVETNVFKLEDGKYYELTFTARAATPRKMMVQVGQLLSAAPWFNALSDGNKIELTEKDQEFSIKFQADKSIADLDSIQVLFGFGTIDDEAIATQVYMDNILLEETEAPVVDSILKVTSVQTTLLEEGGAFANPGTAGIWWVQSADWNCGPAVDSKIEETEKGIKITSNDVEGASWFATQFFVASDKVEPGNYTLTLKMDMNKAGQVTLAANKQERVAHKSAGALDVVEGSNTLKVTFNVLEEAQVGVSLQFGVDGVGYLGAFEAVITDIILVRNGDPEIVDYADPDHLFGTPSKAVNGGEGDSQKNPETFNVWWVQDAGWNCGPAVDKCNFELSHNVLMLSVNLKQDHWWFATQVFYTTKPIEAAGKHVLRFNLQTEVAGTITVNGVKVDLVQGDNKIEVPFENAAGAAFTLSVQLGWEEINGEEHISHTLVGNHNMKFHDFSIDGQAPSNGGGEDPQPTEMVEAPFFKDTTIVAESDEKDAAAHPGKIVYWIDKNWCGSNVEATVTFNEGIITFDITKFEGTNWWGAQLFYYGDAVATASKLTFKLNSTVAGAVQINGADYKLQVGDNVIELNFGVGAQPKLSFQAGTQSFGQLGVAKFIFSDIKFFVPKPADGGEDNPETPEFELYMDGEGNTRNHIEGAGAWIWVKTASIGMTADNFGSFKATVMCNTKTINNQFFSDFAGTYVRLYIEMASAPAGDEVTEFIISITDGTNNFAKTVSFTGNELTKDAAGGSGEGGSGEGGSGEGGSGETTHTPELYMGGEGNNRNHIEGAGAWIWVKTESIGMTAENFGDFTARASCTTAGVRDVIISDLNVTDGYVRFYVVLDPAPAAEAVTVINLNIVHSGELMTLSVSFTGTELTA